ncbi:hypothetical protein EYW00_09655 [Leptospira interrogans serovar Copenhageni]|uniref:Uncharacterized protein n=1 Tax=Leptospira interrogans serovar Bataviae TaxID=312175 RepID=A0AAP9WQ49_LEPIR|nr:hypothetical protein F3G11_12665 [Leptospira interrogans serovar Copenhageni]NUL41685.1 hypothetical protein [Leptospira interrogans serovar Copenhageni]QOI48690.1 hypothetical protein Lepto898_14870 [Leptospira interrogans serovar Icterohaemorrhagiae]QOI52602.1 hypothetical protein Lepto1489_15705 [Leptospira interrogans serovar Bataviae]WPM74503.1 hypothetical protein FYB70_14875 [Leptospira interrogans serovar Icterohaemorrhagiae]
MNSPSVSILWKSAIEAVLLIATMKFFNNSNIDKNFSIYKTLKGKFLRNLFKGFYILLQFHEENRPSHE